MNNYHLDNYSGEPEKSDGTLVEQSASNERMFLYCSQNTSMLTGNPAVWEKRDMPENIDKSINYIEFPLVDKAATMTFFSKVFGWTFQEWGDSYISFSGAGVEGGFNGVDGTPVTAPGVLVVLYAKDLETIRKGVADAGRPIVNDIYDFPGGRRFHFTDPNGTELAVWSEQAP